MPCFLEYERNPYEVKLFLQNRIYEEAEVPVWDSGMLVLLYILPKYDSDLEIFFTVLSHSLISHNEFLQELYPLFFFFQVGKQVSFNFCDYHPFL